MPRQFTNLFTGTSYPPPLAPHVAFPRPYADGFTPNLSGDSAAASVPYADQRVFQETTLVCFLRSKALLLCSRARKVRKKVKKNGSIEASCCSFNVTRSRLLDL